MSTSFEIFPASKKKIDCAKIMEYLALLREFLNREKITQRIDIVISEETLDKDLDKKGHTNPVSLTRNENRYTVFRLNGEHYKLNVETGEKHFYKKCPKSTEIRGFYYSDLWTFFVLFKSDEGPKIYYEGNEYPLRKDLHISVAADTIRSLFEKLVQTFKPFWGCISNKALPRTCGKFLEGTMPMTIQWINYWSEDIVRTVGMERIQELVAFSPAISFHKGILSVKDTAFDAKNEEDIQLYDALQNYLFMEGTLNKILF